MPGSAPAFSMAEEVLDLCSPLLEVPLNLSKNIEDSRPEFFFAVVVVMAVIVTVGVRRAARLSPVIVLGLLAQKFVVLLLDAAADLEILAEHVAAVGRDLHRRYFALVPIVDI